MNPDATRPDGPGDDPVSDTAAGAGGDYSYDLVHEVPDAERPAGETAPGQRDARSARAPAVDPDGDYSSDLAHEVPPQGG